MEKKENEKKQILLRLAPSLWKDLAAWADEDYRSINGQIEFLLSECVRKRKSRSQKEAAMQEKFLSGEITPEEYYAGIQEQLPLVILRQKLRNELGREYCAEHRLEFTKVNPPEDMQRYVENYLEGLLDTCCADITYCK